MSASVQAPQRDRVRQPRETTLRFAAPRSSGPVHRSYWLVDALARGGSESIERLEQDLAVDVCIVGGGYTGLWTALELKRRRPTLSVAVIEGDLCGGGASGRNGGFVMSWWSKFGTLRKLCGEAEAVRLAQQAEASVAAIEQFCVDHGIGSAFSRGGWLWAATNEAQVGAWRGTVEAVAATGHSPFRLLSSAEVSRMAGSSAHVGGVFESGVGIVQPALLARRLAEVARQQGVQIFERTPMETLSMGARNVIATPHGKVKAERVVLALNAWGIQLPPLARALMVISSDVIATEPIPRQIESLGWDPRLGISDSRRLINYYRLTEDSRLVFGKAGGTIARGPRVPDELNGPTPREGELGRHLHRLFPQLSDVAITSSWRGPIDYSITALPFFHQVGGRPDVITVAGFSGNGVGPAHLAATALASKVLDPGDESVPAPLDRIPSRRLPPEPIRYIGARLVRAATAHKEAAEDGTRRPNPLATAIAGLDPTSVVDSGRPR